MSIHIKSIELCNWFQFRGPYKENRFEFQEGLNIIVGNNNAGKTKLHNAFRFMLSDLVRLEKINRKDENDSLYEEYPIDENTISKVFNQREGLELKDGTTATLGVRLTYELRKSEFEYTTFLLEKSMKVKKKLRTSYYMILQLRKCLELTEEQSNLELQEINSLMLLQR